ncbi:phosphatases II [Meredithblackwellia eburnea MCA 4105]
MLLIPTAENNKKSTTRKLQPLNNLQIVINSPRLLTLGTGTAKRRATSQPASPTTRSKKRTTSTSNKSSWSAPPLTGNALPSFPIRHHPSDATSAPPTTMQLVASSPSSSPTTSSFQFPQRQQPQQQRRTPPRLNLPSSTHAIQRPALLLQPASPASPTCFDTAPTSPFPLDQQQQLENEETIAIPSTSSSSTSPSSSFVPPPLPSPLGGLAARRLNNKNKKQLSLVVPNSGSSSSGGALLSPSATTTTTTTTSSSSSLLQPPHTASSSSLVPGSDAAETRSLPPSPISLAAYIGVEGSEQEDRTIGRLMFKAQADEMREQMKGGRSMKRRTSIPSRLNLGVGVGGGGGGGTGLGNGSSGPLSLVASGLGGGAGGRRQQSSTLSLASGSAVGGARSAVQLIRRDAVENQQPMELDSGDEDGAGGSMGEDPEEFPYAHGPREIIPGVWLGSEQNARDPAVLRDWGFEWVLNVAKEVECPWFDDLVSEDEDEEQEEKPEELLADKLSIHDSLNQPAPGQQAQPPLSSSPSPSPPKPRQQKHRRTKTHAAITTTANTNSITSPSQSSGAFAQPVRPLFVRPTASTPNLQSVFNRDAAASAPAPPPLPSIPPGVMVNMTAPIERRNSEGEEAIAATMSRSGSAGSLSKQSSKPVGSSSSRSTTTVTMVGAGGGGRTTFPANGKTGRPALDYLWAKWGHDESDLVEAGKFQLAFDFLDQAKAAGGKVLVHCQCGVSRSATVVIAYCMREAARALEEGTENSELKGVTGMHEAYSFVKEKSEWVGPNLGLVFQLVAYERTLRGASGEDEEEEPPFPDYSNAAVESPRTPLSSGESSADSQISTPPGDHDSISPTFSKALSPTTTSTPLSIITSRPDLKIRVRGEDDDEAVLSPVLDVAGGEDHNADADATASALETARSGVFILPTPPRQLQELSPLPANVTMAPPTPFVEIASPAPSRLTFGQAQPRTASRPNFFPSPPKVTTLTSTPTAAAFAAPKVPTAAQIALSRSGSGGLSRAPPSPVSEGDEGGSNLSPVSRTPFKGFGNQSPSQRRASHRRVFSWSSKDLPAPQPPASSSQSVAPSNTSQPPNQK